MEDWREKYPVGDQADILPFDDGEWLAGPELDLDTRLTIGGIAVVMSDPTADRYPARARWNKTSILNDYVAATDSIRQSTAMHEGEVAEDFERRRLCESVGTLLRVFSGADDTAKAAFTTRARELFREVTHHSPFKIAQAVPNYESAADFVAYAVNCYVYAHNAIQRRRSQPHVQAEKVDRLVLGLFGVDQKTIAAATGISVSSVSMSNTDIKSVVTRVMSGEASWQRTDKLRIPTERSTAIARRYAQGARGKEIMAEFGFGSPSYVTECVRLEIAYQQSVANPDQGLLDMLQARRAIEKSRRGKR